MKKPKYKMNQPVWTVSAYEQKSVMSGFVTSIHITDAGSISYTLSADDNRFRKYGERDLYLTQEEAWAHQQNHIYRA